MTAANKWATFDYWFNWHGHWMHADKAAAEKAWEVRGINGLPNFPGPRA